MTNHAPLRVPFERGWTELDAWIVQRVLAGWSPRALAAAAGVSLRTAYRWRQDARGLTAVTVEGWTATYLIRENKPPVRVSEWRPA